MIVISGQTKKIKQNKENGTKQKNKYLALYLVVMRMIIEDNKNKNNSISLFSNVNVCHHSKGTWQQNPITDLMSFDNNTTHKHTHTHIDILNTPII